MKEILSYLPETKTYGFFSPLEEEKRKSQTLMEELPEEDQFFTKLFFLFCCGVEEVFKKQSNIFPEHLSSEQIESLKKQSGKLLTRIFYPHSIKETVYYVRILEPLRELLDTIKKEIEHYKGANPLKKQEIEESTKGLYEDIQSTLASIFDIAISERKLLEEIEKTFSKQNLTQISLLQSEA